MKYNNSLGGQRKTGFSLLEIVVVLAVLALILAIAMSTYLSNQQLPQLNNATQEIINILRLAQNQTIASKQNSQYGVYFDTSTLPERYVLFKGSSYASRDTAFDQIYTIPVSAEFYQVNTGGANQVVFDKLTGSTENTGNISLRLTGDHSQTKILYVDSSGIIGFTPLAAPADTRQKDSRHVDFHYSRSINSANEDIILTFDGNAIQVIPISSYLDSSGQINLENTFSINGANQTIRIHTLTLNNPDTTFSIFRDGRLNTKSLTVKLSGDSTGTLAEYSADGLTTNFHSIYVSNFAWQ